MRAIQMTEFGGPEVLKLGSRLVWKGRRWGIAQKIIQEVTQFEADKLIEYGADQPGKNAFGEIVSIDIDFSQRTVDIDIDP